MSDALTPEPYTATDASLYPLKTLIRIGAMLGLVFAAFCVFYNVDALSHARLNRELFTWPAALGAGYLFWRGSQTVSRIDKPEQQQKGLKILIGFAAIFSLLALFTPNFHSTDLFGYINRGWQQWHYHTNPYVTVIDQLPGWQNDPMITNHWVTNPSPYGFLYIALAKGLCGISDAIAPGQRSMAVFLFKCVNLLACALTSWLVYAGLRRTQGQQAALSGIYLFAWNPLVIIHTVMNGHNDILMGIGMAAAAFCALTGDAKNNRWLWILPALTAALLIKYAALVIIPFAIVFLWRQKAFSALFGGIMASLALFFGSGYLYLLDWQRFNLSAIQHNAQISHSSLHAFFYHLYKNIASLIPDLKPYKEAVKSFFKTLLLGIYALLMGRWFLNSLGCFPSFNWKQFPILKPDQPLSAERFVELSCYAASALVFLITFKFYPWYILMVYPMGLLLPQGHWLKRLLTWLTLSHLLSITFIGQAHVINYLVMVIVPVVVFFIQEKKTIQPQPVMS